MRNVQISLGLHEFLLAANVIRPTISVGLLYTEPTIQPNLARYHSSRIFIYIYRTPFVTLAHEQKYLYKINK